MVESEQMQVGVWMGEWRVVPRTENVADASPPAHLTIHSGKESVMPKANQPAAKFRLGYVTATVWKNDDYYNVVLSKAYKDGDEWKDTDQLGTGDLMNAVRVLQRAEEFISEQ